MGVGWQAVVAKTDQPAAAVGGRRHGVRPDAKRQRLAGGVGLRNGNIFMGRNEMGEPESVDEPQRHLWLVHGVGSRSAPDRHVWRRVLANQRGYLGVGWRDLDPTQPGGEAIC